MDCGPIWQLQSDNGYLATNPVNAAGNFFSFTYIMSGDVLGFGKRSLLASIAVIDELPLQTHLQAMVAAQNDITIEHLKIAHFSAP